MHSVSGLLLITGCLWLKAEWSSADSCVVVGMGVGVFCAQLSWLASVLLQSVCLFTFVVVFTSVATMHTMLK